MERRGRNWTGKLGSKHCKEKQAVSSLTKSQLGLLAVRSLLEDKMPGASDILTWFLNNLGGYL